MLPLVYYHIVDQYLSYLEDLLFSLQETYSVWSFCCLYFSHVFQLYSNVPIVKCVYIRFTFRVIYLL